MKSVGREGRVQFEGGFGEGVKSWVGVAGLRPPLMPQALILLPHKHSPSDCFDYIYARKNSYDSRKLAL